MDDLAAETMSCEVDALRPSQLAEGHRVFAARCREYAKLPPLQAKGVHAELTRQRLKREGACPLLFRWACPLRGRSPNCACFCSVMLLSSLLWGDPAC